ncbi:MAG: ribonuclease Z [Candidatus Diapherotrites archaeon CG08_land_8_20_14_0_20_34_12]|nr:MAG: ribonuclease Z [Candidatus Diapherotrites archaeon CG08_land_8_20_14_0_20_34_12]
MEPLEITILGTSCSSPTAERNLSSTIVKYRGENLLFDCAEGTQRQIMKANLSYMAINHIFLSHFHADHILGLPGLLATMNMYERDLELNIYGPRGIKQVVEKIAPMPLENLCFKVNCIELKNGIALKGDNFTVKAFELKHRGKCFGFFFKETDKEGEFQREKAISLGIPVGPMFSQLQKGKTIVLNGKKITPEMVMDYNKGRKGRTVAIIVDTMLDLKNAKFIQDADLLIHEAVFTEDLRKRALETKHSTAKDAAMLAKKANAKRLLFTHISSRYSDSSVLEKEAKEIFENVQAARDLMKINL